MASIKQINLGGTSYDLGALKMKVFYGTCETGAGTAAKVVSCPEMTTAPQGGEVIFIYFEFGNTVATPTLNINGKGAVATNYSGDYNCLPEINAGTTCLFVFDDNNDEWFAVSSRVQDRQVQQSASTSASEFPVMVKGTADSTDRIEGLKYSASATLKPSTSTLRLVSGTDNGRYNPARIQLTRSESDLDIWATGANTFINKTVGNNLYVGVNATNGSTQTVTDYTATQIALKTAGTLAAHLTGGMFYVDNQSYYVDGHKVTLSSSAPSSPAAGDIWFDLSSAYGQGQYVVAGSTDTSATAFTGTSVTKVPLNTAKSQYGEIFQITDGGVKVLQAGNYRVCGGVYINSGVSTTKTISTFSDLRYGQKGCYLIAGGTSFDSTNEVASLIVITTMQSAVAVAPVIVTLSANEMVYLAARNINPTSGGTGTFSPGNKATFLLVEKIPN